jgi:L-serine dehydratase
MSGGAVEVSGKARLLSLFDVLGPIMTGPSSSATAGAVKIGRMGRMFLGGQPEEVDLYFSETFGCKYRGNSTDAAVIGGLMGFAVDAPEIRNAREIAASRGMKVTIRVKSEEAPATDAAPKPISIEMDLRRKTESIHVTGLSIGGSEIVMSEVDGFPLELQGNEDGFLVFSSDGGLEGALEGLFGNNLLGLDRIEKGGRFLYVGTLERPPTAISIEKAEELPGVTRAVFLQNLLSYRLYDAEPLFGSIAGMVRFCEENGMTMADAAVAYEVKRSRLAEAVIRQMAADTWKVMKASVEEGIKGKNPVLSGLVPGDAGCRLARRAEEGLALSGRTVALAAARALACMECDACMGRVVAAPTAGAAGVIPGALLTASEALGATEEQVVDALLVSAAVGSVIALAAPVSGTMGGCQSEVGVASAMTASALAHLGGGTPSQAAHAMAIALKNVLGLVCDPVAGAVEVPCIKRNAMGVANAFVAADMALAGIESAIPADEVIMALCNVQKLLPVELRASARGGLGITPTAQRLMAEKMERLAKEAAGQ